MISIYSGWILYFKLLNIIYHLNNYRYLELLSVLLWVWKDEMKINSKVFYKLQKFFKECLFRKIFCCSWFWNVLHITYPVSISANIFLCSTKLLKSDSLECFMIYLSFKVSVTLGAFWRWLSSEFYFMNAAVEQ